MRFINFLTITFTRGFANLTQSSLLQDLVINETQSVLMSKQKK